MKGGHRQPRGYRCVQPQPPKSPKGPKGSARQGAHRSSGDEVRGGHARRNKGKTLAFVVPPCKARSHSPMVACSPKTTASAASASVAPPQRIRPATAWAAHLWTSWGAEEGRRGEEFKRTGGGGGRSEQAWPARSAERCGGGALGDEVFALAGARNRTAVVRGIGPCPGAAQTAQQHNAVAIGSTTQCVQRSPPHPRPHKADRALCVLVLLQQLGGVGWAAGTGSDDRRVAHPAELLVVQPTG